MMLVRLSLLMACATLTTGCAQLMVKELMNGPEACPARQVNQIHETRKMMPFIREGMTLSQAQFILRHDAAFEKQYTLPEGRSITAHYYLYQEPDTCRYAVERPERYQAIYFEDNRVIGIRDYFYDEMIQPYLVQAVQGTSEQWLGANL